MLGTKNAIKQKFRCLFLHFYHQIMNAKLVAVLLLGCLALSALADFRVPLQKIKRSAAEERARIMRAKERAVQKYLGGSNPVDTFKNYDDVSKSDFFKISSFFFLLICNPSRSNTLATLPLVPLANLSVLSSILVALTSGFLALAAMTTAAKARPSITQRSPPLTNPTANPSPSNTALALWTAFWTPTMLVLPELPSLVKFSVRPLTWLTSST
jgi:hypothetical protein